MQSGCKHTVCHCVQQAVRDLKTTRLEFSRRYFGKGGRNHLEQFKQQKRILAYGGLMLRRCHDVICMLSPLILGCEAMWLSDNILPSEIYVESLCLISLHQRHLFKSEGQQLGCRRSVIIGSAEVNGNKHNFHVFIHILYIFVLQQTAI